jgi:uncharacterized protein
MFRSVSPRFAAPLLGISLAIAIPLATTLSTIGLSARPAMTQEQAVRTLSVRGEGVEQIATSIAQVNLGIEVQGKTAAEVQAQAAQKSTAVVALLKSRQVERLQTTGINLSPQYSYDNGKQRLLGYMASNSVSFRVANDKAGAIMDDAVKAGATRIDGISFTASDEAIAAARKKALQAATQRAREEGDAVLSSLNFTAKDIVSIQVDGAAPPPQPIVLERARMAFASKADAETPVVGGEQTVRAGVTLQIRY